jgi:RNA binding exosome subunit
MQSPVAYIDIRLFIHATEDEDKVKRAAHSLFSSSHESEIVLKETSLRGYYGNPITLLETHIKSPRLIESLVGNLASRLGASDKRAILMEAERHIDRRNLILRLDKQAALESSLRLRKDDPIHVRMHFKKNKVIETCQVLGLFPES